MDWGPGNSAVWTMKNSRRATAIQAKVVRL
jgi:hypothetical protein